MQQALPMASPLSELLGSLSARQFLQDFFHCRPLAMSGTGVNLSRRGDRTVALRLLDQPGTDILVSRGGEIWSKGAPSSATASEILAQGFTIGIRHAERHDSGLAELARAFEHDLHCPVDLHLYWTPAGNPGLGWHYDAEDVFLLQTEGEKEWSLRKNTVNPWPLLETLPQNMRYERELSPLIKCTLRAGDWLYLPSGYWHTAIAGAESESISLSIGLLSPTGIDLLDFIRVRFVDSMLWRERLPVSGAAADDSEGETLARYRERIAVLAADLASLLSEPWLAERFLEHRRETFCDSRYGTDSQDGEPG